MKLCKIVTGALLLSCWPLTAALAQPDQTPTTIANPPVVTPIAPRPAAPKAQIEFDLREFFVQLNQLKDEGILNNSPIAAHISGGRIGFFGASEWTNSFVAARGQTRFQFDKIEFETLETDTARVQVSYALLIPNNRAPVAGEPREPQEPPVQIVNETETLDLKREIVPWTREEKWRIVAPKTEALKPYLTLSLQHIAFYGSQRAGTLSQLRGEISASRLKQCALGVMQLTQDYDERYAFENEFWREAIRPYVQNDALFLIPGTRDFYTFNDHLSDKKLAELDSIAQTVLFYEGTDETPIFRYNGKAAICFADGHVEFVAPDAAKTLIWKP